MRTRLIQLSVVVGILLAAPVDAQTVGIREVSASERTLIPLQTRIRYTTMIVLPEGEQILDVICGDKDFWMVSATQNIAHIKPAKEGAATNLNLVTATGAIYSFLLVEKNGAGTPDLTVYVTADTRLARPKPKYYSAEHLEHLEAQLAEVRSAAEASQRRSAEAIDAFQHGYPTRLTFPFGAVKYAKPFYVRAIWQDGQFTYIRSDATELPTLYEMKDGAPSLLNFQVQNGTYVIPKLLVEGYLAIGKARFGFAQQER